MIQDKSIEESQVITSDLNSCLQTQELLWDNLPDVVFILDQEGKILKINNVISEYGYDPEVLIDEDISCLIHPEDYSSSERGIKERRTGDRSTKDLIVRVMTKDDEKRMFDTRIRCCSEFGVFKINSTGIYNGESSNNQKFIGTLGIARDITKKHNAVNELKKNERIFESILDASPSGIGHVMPNQTLGWCNNAMCDILGYSQGELEGNSVDILFENKKIGREILKKIYKQLKKDGKAIVETFMVRKDGNKICVIIRANPIEKSDISQGFITTVEDLTERKLTESELITSEERFRTIADFTNDLEYWIDENGKYLYVSPSCEMITGYKPEEFISDEFVEKLVHAEDLEIFRNHGDLFAEDTSKNGDYEFRIISKSGEVRWIHHMCQPVFNKEGEWRGRRISNRDITKRKQAEESLREQTKRLNMALDASNEGLWDVNLESGDVYFSPRFYTMLGYEPYEMEASYETFTSLLHPDEKAKCLSFIEERLSIVENNYEMEFRLKTKSDQWRWIQSNGQIVERNPEGNPVRIIGTHVDITEKKNAENALIESERRFRELAELMPETIYELDLNSKLIFVNESAFNQFGYTKDDFYTGMSVFDMLVPEDRERAKQQIENIFSGAKPGLTEYTALRKDGSTFASLSHSSIITKDGCIAGLRGFIIDITSQKRVENALREIAEGVLARTGEDFFEAVVVYLAQTLGVEYCYVGELGDNGDMNTLSVYSKTRIEENYSFNIKDTAAEYNLNNGLVSETESADEFFVNDAIIKKRGFKSYAGIPIKNSGKEDSGIIAVMSEKPFEELDFVKTLLRLLAVRVNSEIERRLKEKEKQKLEDQLYHSQKLESIGRLAGGIAHDFNNILASIMGYAELLKVQLSGAHDSILNPVNIILNGTIRASNLTTQLLGFARKGKFNPVILNINEMLREGVKVLEKIFEKNITVDYDLDTEIDFVEADKSQVDQVFTNIIINAKDAMPKGGQLAIKTEQVVFGGNNIENPTELKEGKYIKASISDTGTGISSEVLEKIFDPFFTTKSEGKGTGLGLATVYGIVKNHNGHVEVESIPGEGTVFSIYFPASSKRQVQMEEISEQLTEGEGAVLIVDDEENIRNLTEEILLLLGYKVLTAKDGKEAIDIYSSQKDEIDLIILDIIMPVMNGKDTFHELRKIKPDVKVLLSSGYSQERKAKELIKAGASGFIQKPFPLQELSKKIREVLTEN